MSDVKSLADFTAKNIEGAEVNLGDFEGKVVMVVNTASQCGLTPQYAGLQELYTTYSDRGLVILGFPCDQFAGQEPGEEAEIAQFCESSFGVTFPMFSKIKVNGKDTAPLWDWLKTEQKGLMGGTIKWNFTKFLIGKDGKPVARFSPKTDPLEITPDIEALL
ncbi:MAG: glutathione peroxidase [Actinomycetales bacterium]|nr:glutathione peroxidase [Actinomycetales bacterium]